MANNYEITMKQYNGNDYDTLYPKNVSQQVLLNSSDIANQLGLNISNPTIADAISKLQLNIYDNIVTMGTYIGTGEYGASHPNSLTFNFVPRIIIILGDESVNLGYGIGIFMGGCLSGFSAQNQGHSLTVTWDTDGKKVDWYNSNNTSNQLNVLNATYTYVAI